MPWKTYLKYIHIKKHIYTCTPTHIYLQTIHLFPFTLLPTTTQPSIFACLGYTSISHEFPSYYLFSIPHIDITPIDYVISLLVTLQKSLTALKIQTKNSGPSIHGTQASTTGWLNRRGKFNEVEFYLLISSQPAQRKFLNTKSCYSMTVKLETLAPNSYC